MYCSLTGTILTTCSSAISAFGGPVSSGNAEVCPSMDRAWFGHHHRLPARTACPQNHSRLRTHRVRNSKTCLVQLHPPRQVCRPGQPQHDSVELTKLDYRTLSMTFGRPSIIPEKYVKLELPSASIQVMGQVPDGDVTQRIDAMYFQATM